MVGQRRGHHSSSADDDKLVPLYHAGVSARDGQALKYVRENTPRGPMADLVRFFTTTKENLCIVPAYRTTLSPWQLENFAVITDRRQWDRIGFAKTFAREVEEYKFLTFDLERRHNEETEATRTVLAHFATASGKSTMFDLEQMAGSDDWDEEMVLRDIPPLFRQWMRSEKIYTVGSAIGGDEERIGFRLGRKVDMRDVFLHYRAVLHEGKPIIDIGETTKCGFGVQAWYSKGMDYRPMTIKKHTALYGTHEYRTLKGGRYWPDFKHWSIYRWKRDEFGSIALPGKFYNFHDATCAPSCISTIFLDMAAGPSIRVQGSCSVADEIEAVLEPVVRARRAPEQEELEDGEVIDNVDQVPSGQGSEASGTITVSSAPEEIVLSTSPSHSEDGLSLYGEEDNLLEEVGGQPPEKKTRTSSQDAVVQGIPHYKAPWDRDVDRWNPYERNPVWGRRCEIYGVGKHSGYNREGQPMCPMLLHQLKPICLYARCGRSGHKTMVCEKLHQICPVCWHRGHDRLAGCASWRGRDWTKARNDFEAAAPLGYFTMRRHHNERWGFWPAVFGTPFPYPLKYRDLLEMSVGEADKALKEQRKGIAVSAGSVTAPEQHPLPLQGPQGAPARDRIIRAAFPKASRLGDRLGPRPGTSGNTGSHSHACSVPSTHSHPVSSRTRSASGTRRRSEEDEEGPERSGRARADADARGGSSRSASGSRGRLGPEPRVRFGAAKRK